MFQLAVRRVLQDVLGQTTGRLVEAEPPRRPLPQEVLGAGQKSDQPFGQGQAGHALGRRCRQGECRRDTQIDADDVCRAVTEHIQHSEQVHGDRGCLVAADGGCAVAQPVQVRRDGPETCRRQPGCDIAPDRAGVRETVQQQYGGPLPESLHDEFDPVDRYPVHGRARKVRRQSHLGHRSSLVTLGNVVTVGNPQ
jgi:hypothetical protein